MEEDKILRNRNIRFMIAEGLACLSFILNTVCVINMKGVGFFGSAPQIDFNYILKTILAVIGIFYFFSTGVFSIRQAKRYIRVFTLIILLYSVPIINLFLVLPFAIVFKRVLSLSFGYNEMIIIQIIWSIPVLCLVRDAYIRLLKSKLLTM